MSGHDQSLGDKGAGLAKICRDFGVERLWIFGSGAKNEMRAYSDLDFAVSFRKSSSEMSPLEQFFGFQRTLEQLFGRQVDLVEWSAAKNPFFRREVERTRRELYAA